ncbi:hypothetical protein M1295_01460 [Patescibacteria group bacterium]|nr:hypothetical protein [Patescibacteria group bacterium]
MASNKMQQQNYMSFMKKMMKGGMSMTQAAKEWRSSKHPTKGSKMVWDKKDKRMETPTQMRSEGEKVPSYKKGGKVRKTGLALLHKGEHVIPKGKSRKSSSKIMQKHPGGTSTIKTSTRKKSATIVQKNRQGGQKYRFPMPDKAHARAALADLPKAQGLSSKQKTTIRSRAERMLGNKDRIKRSLRKTMGYA